MSHARPDVAHVVHDPPSVERAGRLRPVLAGLLVKDPARQLSLDRARSLLQAVWLAERG